MGRDPSVFGPVCYSVGRFRRCVSFGVCVGLGVQQPTTTDRVEGIGNHPTGTGWGRGVRSGLTGSVTGWKRDRPLHPCTGRGPVGTVG